MRKSVSKVERSGMMSIGAAVALYLLLMIWTPAGVWSGALHFAVTLAAGVCMYRGVFLHGKASGLRARSTDRRTMVALGYRLGLLESSGIQTTARVEYDGETIFERDQE